MSFITRRIFTKFCPKRLSSFIYVNNAVRLSRAQYYSLIYSDNERREVFKPERLKKREYSVMTVILHKYHNFITALTDVFKGRFRYIPFFGSVKYKLSGYLWFETLEAVKVEDFFVLFQMPDTYYSRFKVLELHVWMLLFYLPEGSRTENLVKNGLIEAMWEDIEKRAKLIDKNNKAFKKNMITLYEEFKVCLLLYDVGCSKDDASLANALWYCFFNKENVDPRLLEALVYFVRYQMHVLQKLNLQKLSLEKKKGDIWVSPKPFVDRIFGKTSDRGKVLSSDKIIGKFI